MFCAVIKVMSNLDLRGVMKKFLVLAGLFVCFHSTSVAAEQPPNIVMISVQVLSLNLQSFDIARPKAAEVEDHTPSRRIPRPSRDGGVVPRFSFVGI